MSPIAIVIFVSVWVWFFTIVIYIEILKKKKIEIEERKHITDTLYDDLADIREKNKDLLERLQEAKENSRIRFDIIRQKDDELMKYSGTFIKNEELKQQIKTLNHQLAEAKGGYYVENNE